MISSDVEGRLPIRRPSGINQMISSSPFINKHNQLLILGKNKGDQDADNKEEGKGELDYIGADESGDREDINSFLSRSLFTNKFQLVWALTLFIAHTYHLLAIFWYLGLPDYPENELLALQIIFEFVLIIDFVLRILIKTFTNEVWESMWLLHDYFAFSTKIGLTLSIIATFPIMFIIT